MKRASARRSSNPLFYGFHDAEKTLRKWFQLSLLIEAERQRERISGDVHTCRAR